MSQQQRGTSPKRSSPQLSTGSAESDINRLREVQIEEASQAGRSFSVGKGSGLGAEPKKSEPAHPASPHQVICSERICASPSSSRSDTWLLRGN